MEPTEQEKLLGKTITNAIREARKAAGGSLEWRELEAVVVRVFTDNRKKSSDEKPDFGDPKKIPPDPEQVSAYSTFIGYPLDGDGWCDTYEQKGWMVGRTKMKNWQSAVRNWKRSGYVLGNGNGTKIKATTNYGKI